MKKTALVTAYITLLTHLSAQVISSNFNTNNDGWQARDSPLGGFNPSGYQATGGNPSGHISARDILPVSTMYFVAPSKFLGNKSWAYDNTLTFDLKVQTGTFFAEDDVIIEGNGVVLAIDLPNPTTSWTSYTCTLNEFSGWKIGTRNGPVATKAEVQNALCNVSRLWIRAEFFSNFLVFDEGYLDNVALNITPCTPNLNAQTRTICTGQSVVLNGKTYNQTGIFADTIKRCYPQCDSVINLNLTVVDAFRTSQNFTICQGNAVVFNNKTYNQTGIYRDTLRSISNCDSIITTNLTVLGPLSKIQNLSICEGDFIRINNKNYTQTGVYKDTLRTNTNCDSIVTTNLTVNKTFNRTQNISICPNGSYSIGTKTYNSAGIYRDTLKTINNCDSIIITNLSIQNAFVRTQNIRLCTGEFISINNKNYNQTGIYRDTFRTIQGCDSVVITDLIINPIVTKNQNFTICSGNSIVIGFKTYNLSGIYRDTLKTITNCDSILITNLTVLAPLSKTQNLSICAGNSIVINNKTYNQTGIYRDTLKTNTNCDSILITNLTVLAPLSKTQNLSICEGDFIRINNKNYTQTGVYKDTLRTNSNCDSIVTTNLIVNTKYNRTQNILICPEFVYTINNKNYNRAGIYKDTLRTINNCDSIITTNLSLLPNISDTNNVRICAGEFITVNNRMYNQTGVYRDTFVSNASCDRFLITNLIVNPISITNKNITICSGNSIVINNKTYNSSGIYRDTLKTITNCDSILITNLTVLGPLSKTQNLSICAGNSIVINNKTYNQTGIYRDTLKTNTNCDSILITNLTVLGPLSKIQNLSICEGDFIRINNKSYTQTGVYKDTLRTNSNCDSIVTTNLIVNTKYNRTQNVIICPNSFYSINNKNYNQIGTYKDTLRTINNCDSIVITNLSFDATIIKNQLMSICKGDSIRINNKFYSQIGIYRDTFKIIGGCDSVLITNLTQLPERKRTIDTSVCEGKTLIINAKSYLKTGNYKDTIRLNGQCDSVLIINLKITPLTIIKKEITLCVNDSIVINGRVFKQAIVFRDTLISTINCNEIIEWTIKQSNLQLNMGAYTVIEQGDSLQLTPSVFGAQNIVWTWQTDKSLSCTNCANPVVKPLFTTTFTLTIKDTLTNCSLKDAIKITVKPCENIFMPTAFSPNNDGTNDYFTVFASNCVRKIKKMQVFNRWGVLVFSKENIVANNEKNGWDGTMNNIQLPTGVYIYVIELELGDGKSKVFSGDVTLIR